MMSILNPNVVEYPESDGQPMGETDLHIRWLIRLRDILQTHFNNRPVYVGADLLVYYEEGDNQKFVVPDLFVVLGSNPAERRTFKLWEEGCSPNVVLEITSRSTAKRDLIDKRDLYEQIGVEEYFLFDPAAEYLTPALQGFRLVENRFVAMELIDSCLESQQCNLRLKLNDGWLELFDLHTGQRLTTEAERERQGRLAAEQELERLRTELKNLKQAGE